MAELLNANARRKSIFTTKTKTASSKEEIFEKNGKVHKMKKVLTLNKIFMKNKETKDEGSLNKINRKVIDDIINSNEINCNEINSNDINNNEINIDENEIEFKKEENKKKSRGSFTKLNLKKKKVMTKNEIAMLKDVLSPITERSKMIYKSLKKVEGRMAPRVTKKCIHALVKVAKSSTKKTVVEDENSVDLAVGGIIANTKNWANNYKDLFEPLNNDIASAQNVFKKLLKKHPENAVLKKVNDGFEKIKVSLAINMAKENKYLKKADSDIFYDAKGLAPKMKSKSVPFNLAKKATVKFEDDEDDIFYDAKGEKQPLPPRAKSEPFNLDKEILNDSEDEEESLEEESLDEESLEEYDNDNDDDDDDDSIENESIDDESINDEFFDAKSQIWPPPITDENIDIKQISNEKSESRGSSRRSSLKRTGAHIFGHTGFSYYSN